MILLHGISEIVTPVGSGAVHGRAMRELNVIRNAAVAIDGERVAWCGPERDWSGVADLTYDCAGCAMVPALIDPHTHAIWAGDRLADFEARASGVTYEQILQAGGGIRSTVRATVNCPVEMLASLARPRVDALIRSGAATIEVKSGYGFEPDAELRMLEAVRLLSAGTRARLVPTLLIHIPPLNGSERAGYVHEVCSAWIPEAARRGLALALDVFVEKDAWSAAEAEQMVAAAHANALPFKLHTEQFTRIGGLDLGVAYHALSVDHLEACVPEQITALAASSTIATILPGVSLHLGIPAAPGRALIDAGAAVAIGTDLNPGSSPCFSVAAALAWAVRLNGLTPPEALTCGTANAAAALGLEDCGRIAPGMRADLLLVDGSDWRELIYRMGDNPVRALWIAGERVIE